MENVERLQEAEIRKFDWVFPFDLSITLTAAPPFMLLVGKNTLCLEYKYKYKHTKKHMHIQEYNVWCVHHTHNRAPFDDAIEQKNI